MVCCTTPNLAAIITLGALTRFDVIRSDMLLVGDSMRTPVATVVYHHMPRMDSLSAVELSPRVLQVTVTVRKERA